MALEGKLREFSATEILQLLATQRKTMGDHVIGPRLKALGWLATAVMAVVVAAMIATI